jgi:Cu2+-exporting ATPase
VTGDELRLASHDLGEGVYQTEIAVPGVHCAACIRAVETGLIELPGVEHVRLNLSTRRVRVKWRGAVPPLLETLAELGYPGHLFTIEDDRSDPAFGRWPLPASAR